MSSNGRGKPRRGPHPGWSDKRLVRECLRGSDQAWDSLVDKYKNLVYAVAVKGGVSPDDAADLFQGVWVDVYEELANLRKQESLRSWLISITRHKCYHWRHRRQREVARRGGTVDDTPHPALAVDATEAEELERLEQEQMVREAVLGLPARCQELIRLLFYTDPPRPYRQIAEHLGLAIGSIGFIRGRCLKRLEKSLERRGLG